MGSSEEKHVTAEQMSDQPFYLRYPQPTAQADKRLFEFIRCSDGAPITCDLRFRGESYGWEVRFLEGGELFYSRGAFIFREAAVRWAEQERNAMEESR